MYANLRSYSVPGDTEFAYSIQRGRINLFKDYESQPVPTVSANGMTSFSFYSDPEYYYNKGLEPLKLATYNSLKKDLTDHPASLKYLDKIPQTEQTKKYLFIAGGLLTVGFLATLENQGETKPNNAPTFLAHFNRVSLLAGIGCFGIGWGLSLSKDEIIKESIRIYNE